ncbi:MAG: hypothetical protein NTNFB02_20860 [Nitrospira sp.]
MEKPDWHQDLEDRTREKGGNDFKWDRGWDATSYTVLDEQGKVNDENITGCTGHGWRGGVYDHRSSSTGVGGKE